MRTFARFFKNNKQMKKKIRKKLLGFDVGMTYYSTLEKDEEDITRGMRDFLCGPELTFA